MYASDLKHPDTSLEMLLEQVYALNRNIKIDLSFRPEFIELLHKFGNPHLKLPPVIHIAGTNGKGSCVAILRSILEEAGYRVHAYTSPHLQRFNERIVLAGKEITDESLEPLLREALSHNEGNPATFFEITTALAFAAFSRVPADILLLEVGLGGRLDCTNIIESALVSIIQPIGYDHMEHLGSTLEEIAGEKAGIMKRGVPVISGPQKPEVMTVLQDASDSAHASFYACNFAFFAEPHDASMRFRFPAEQIDMILPRPALIGIHQIQNAGVVLATLRVIAESFPVKEEALKEGLRKVSWPARLQRVNGSLNRLMNPGWEIWLDGGHNVDAAMTLSEQARDWQTQDSRNLHVILGMMNHKDPAEFLKPLHPYVTSLHAIDIPGEPNALKAAALADSVKATPHLDLHAALRTINATKKPGRILITGSLYLAGHVLNIDHDYAHNRP
jgi:dihydrofolate synthase / folylpolyglutamate synthase